MPGFSRFHYRAKWVTGLGRTALHYAAKSGLVELSRELMYLPSIDPTAADDGGSTARDHALDAGHDDVAKILPRAMTSPHGTRGKGYPQAPQPTPF